MSSKAIYARLQAELYEKVKEYADKTGHSISSAVEDLIQHGIAEVSSEGLESLERQVAELKGSLEAYKAKESIAMAAQSHALALQQETEKQRHQIEQLRDCLLTPVATCRNCHTKLRLFDVGQRRCPYCGNWNMELLPDYSVPPTTWEVIRDGAAVVGVTAVVVALLNALAGGQQRS